MAGTGGSIFGGSGTIPANVTEKRESPVVSLTAGANYVFISGLSDLTDTSIFNGAGDDISSAVSVTQVGGTVTVSTNVFIPNMRIAVTGTA